MLRPGPAPVGGTVIAYINPTNPTAPIRRVRRYSGSDLVDRDVAGDGAGPEHQGALPLGRLLAGLEITADLPGDGLQVEVRREAFGHPDLDIAAGRLGLDARSVGDLDLHVAGTGGRDRVVADPL